MADQDFSIPPAARRGSRARGGEPRRSAPISFGTARGAAAYYFTQCGERVPGRGLVQAGSRQPERDYGSPNGTKDPGSGVLVTSGATVVSIEKLFTLVEPSEIYIDGKRKTFGCVAV
jgi:hypothetical protein